MVQYLYKLIFSFIPFINLPSVTLNNTQQIFFGQKIKKNNISVFLSSNIIFILYFGALASHFIYIFVVHLLLCLYFVVLSLHLYFCAAFFIAFILLCCVYWFMPCLIFSCMSHCMYISEPHLPHQYLLCIHAERRRERILVRNRRHNKITTSQPSRQWLQLSNTDLILRKYSAQERRQENSTYGRITGDGRGGRGPCVCCNCFSFFLDYNIMTAVLTFNYSLNESCQAACSSKSLLLPSLLSFLINSVE